MFYRLKYTFRSPTSLSLLSFLFFSSWLLLILFFYFLKMKDTSCPTQYWQNKNIGQAAIPVGIYFILAVILLGVIKTYNIKRERALRTHARRTDFQVGKRGAQLIFFFKFFVSFIRITRRLETIHK